MMVMIPSCGCKNRRMSRGWGGSGAGARRAGTGGDQGGRSGMHMRVLHVDEDNASE